MALTACATPPAPPQGAFRPAGAPIWSSAQLDSARLAGDWRQVAGFGAEGCRPGGVTISGRTTLTAAFRYRDEMADREEELRIGFADGRWAVAEGTADVTVICRQGDLAALLMGSCGLTALLRLGAASADDAEKARQLAQLLYCVQKPWLNADY